MKSRGMTLIELLVTMIIGGVMAFVVGMIIVSSFTESSRAMQQTSLQNDVRFFERRLAKQFRSAVNDAGSASIIGGGTSLEFVSYAEDGSLTNNFLHYRYRVQGGALVCTVTPGTRDPVTNNFLFPGLGSTVNVLENIDSVTFSWANPQQNTVRTVLVQRQRLAGGKVYLKTSTFDVLSRNRS